MYLQSAHLFLRAIQFLEQLVLAMKNKVRSNESLCEKSMKMVTNMVKLSSLSISKVSLGISGPPPATKNLASVTASLMVVDKPPLLQFPGNRRSQEPQSGTKPMGYLIAPVAGNGSSSIIREDNSIDGKASDYIEKVRKKIRCASNKTTNHSAYIMPPPTPRVVKLSSSPILFLFSTNLLQLCWIRIN